MGFKMEMTRELIVFNLPNPTNEVQALDPEGGILLSWKAKGHTVIYLHAFSNSWTLIIESADNLIVDKRSLIFNRPSLGQTLSNNAWKEVRYNHQLLE
jgi:hypothetical protein